MAGRAWPCVDVDPGLVAPFERRLRDGRSYPLMTVTMPAGTRFDGVDLGGWRHTAYMTRGARASWDAGRPVRVAFAPDRPVELWRVDGRRRERAVVSDPEGLCGAIRTAGELSDLSYVTWTRDLTARVVDVVDGAPPSRERQMVLDFGGTDRFLLHTRTLVPMLSRLSGDMRVGDLAAVGRRDVSGTLDGMAGRVAGVSGWVSWLGSTGVDAASSLDAAPSRLESGWAGDGVARTAGGYHYEPLAGGYGLDPTGTLPTTAPAPRAGFAR